MGGTIARVLPGNDGVRAVDRDRRPPRVAGPTVAVDAARAPDARADAGHADVAHAPAHVLPCHERAVRHGRDGWPERADVSRGSSVDLLRVAGDARQRDV